MYIWSRYKFLILFLILAIGAPFLITKVTSSLLQEARSASSGVSPCLSNNPPTIWLEKSQNSRKGYAPSGISNLELLSIDLITCGEVNIKGFNFIVETDDYKDVLNSASFSLNVFGQTFNMKTLTQYSNNKLLVSFGFDEPVNISVLGSTQKIFLLGTFSGDHSGKTTFYLKDVILRDGSSSKVSINKAESTLIFEKK